MKRAVLAVFALLLSACSSVQTASPGAAGSGNPWTHHGVLRIADLGEPDTLNVMLSNYAVSNDLAQLWGSFFFYWSDKDQFVPEMATEVPTLQNGGISADGKSFTYHLRPGVTWSDGVPFTADDVIFSWHAIMSPKNNVVSRVAYDRVTSIDKKNDHTIVVHIKAPFAPFVSEFFATGGLPVLPAHLLASLPDVNHAPYNSQPIGTGPFTVQHWQRGSKIIFVANPHYWRGAPKLTRIEYNPIPDENTIVTLLRTHEADLEFNGSANLYPQFQTIGGMTVTLTPFSQYGELAFNLKSPILSDIAVRRALAYATDRQGIITRIGHDVNLLSWTVQPAFSWAHNPKVREYPYDLNKAKQILAADGWVPGADGIRVKNGQKLSVVYANVAGSKNGTQLGTLLQEVWRSIGVDFQFKNYPASLMFTSAAEGGIILGGKFDVSAFSQLLGSDPDDSTIWMCDQVPPNGQNSSRFCDPAVDAAQRIALSSYDQETRRKAYFTSQEIIAEQLPVIVTNFQRRINIYNTDLKNYKPAHAISSFWNSWEWEI